MTTVAADAQATKDIVHQFANAIKERNFDVQTSLLAHNGKYEIQDEKLEPVDCKDRSTFISWLKSAVGNVVIEKVEFDQCLLCMIGNPVVLFNEGKFPPVRKDGMSRSMQGIMLNVKDGIIIETRFCYTFLSKENKTQFECLHPKIDALMDSGLSFAQAMAKVSRDEGYPDDALGGYSQ